MRTGLALGKFAPLHHGHQLLIERAMDENDLVIVIIYDCPETTTIPLHIRAGWIRRLYPTVEVIEAWDGPRDVGDTPEIKRRHEEYLLATLAGRKIDAFYSSEFYGEHVSAALGAQDLRIDSDRTIIPVSGTAVREAPFAHRQFIHPLVYRDLVWKVVLLGAPCTGKTTLARRLAEQFGTVWVPEFGREYWERHHVERRLTLAQLVEIAEGHIAREEELIRDSDRLVFIDTDARITRIFSEYYHGKVDPRLDRLARQAAARYDLTLLCGDEIPYDDTWDRSGEVSRTWMQQRIMIDLQERSEPFLVLEGTLDERVQKVRELLTSGCPVGIR